MDKNKLNTYNLDLIADVQKQINQTVLKLKQDPDLKMISRQLTWYNKLTSEEVTATTRDVEPIVLCSDKVRFIDPLYRLDLLPINEEFFLPPKGNRATGRNTIPTVVTNAQTLTQKFNQ